MSLVELNADVGEGFDDEALLPHVDRASIACGGHVGDEISMRTALLRCRALGVVPGAHPSYPDRAGFGRRAFEIEEAALAATVAEQIRALAAIARELELPLAHVKPHGALYLRAWRDDAVAEAVAEAIVQVDAHLALLAPAGSALLAAAARRGLRVLREGFVDRRYLAEGNLAPRDLPGACERDLGAAVAQGVALARGEATGTLDGATLKLAVDSLCLHGDAPQPVELARTLRQALHAAGLTVRPVSPSLQSDGEGASD